LIVACGVSTPQFSMSRTLRPHSGALRLLQKVEGTADVVIGHTRVSVNDFVSTHAATGIRSPQSDHVVRSRMTELTAEQVFRLHDKIRWAGFATESGQVTFCQMRAGVTSYTPEEADRSFMELGPLLITGISERLTPSELAGKVQNVIINFEKASVLLTKLKHGFLAVSVDRAHAPHVFEEIAGPIRRLSD